MHVLLLQVVAEQGATAVPPAAPSLKVRTVLATAR